MKAFNSKLLRVKTYTPICGTYPALNVFTVEVGVRTATSILWGLAIPVS
jgi:hypothetical protein